MGRGARYLPSVEDLEAARTRMLTHDLRGRGIRDERVLAAMAAVRREDFVAPELRALAYDDGPLPIGEGQTISQPYVVAFMAEALALQGDERALEVGAGCGYAAAVLSKLCREVYAIELLRALGDAASTRLARLGYATVHVRVGDGSVGWREHAPYDAIVVSAAAPRVPEALIEQLAVGGRLVVPVGTEHGLQRLVRLERTARSTFEETSLGPVRFVPLLAGC
jgi:protein-L-isoaspartate(D-aspartate) O-methyltransferase